MMVLLTLTALVKLLLMSDRPCWWTWRRLNEQTEEVWRAKR